MINSIPNQNAFQYYSNLFEKLNQDADQLNETVMDSHQGTSDVFVNGLEVQRGEDKWDLISLDKTLQRTDDNLSYSEKEEKTDFSEMATKKEQRSVEFYQEKDGSYKIYHRAGGESASWEFYPDHGPSNIRGLISRAEW